MYSIHIYLFIYSDSLIFGKMYDKETFSPGGREKCRGVMKKLEIDREGVTAFLVNQAGGHVFLKHTLLIKSICM
jgi:hypothetical protein